MFYKNKTDIEKDIEELETLEKLGISIARQNIIRSSLLAEISKERRESNQRILKRLIGNDRNNILTCNNNEYNNINYDGHYFYFDAPYITDIKKLKNDPSFIMPEFKNKWNYCIFKFKELPDVVQIYGKDIQNIEKIIFTKGRDKQLIQEFN